MADSVLAQYGLIDYYPSEKFVDFSRGNLQVYEKALGTELLATETHTGPWVAEVGTPRWFSYIRPDTLSAGEGTLDVSLEFKQRQLLHARYLPRTLSCTAMFNPYVTPGFPGVVFDSVDAGFAFAGFVLAVTHDFSAESATTSVEFNYVRMLDEAACVEIPNPLESVQMITHDERYLAPVYRSLLGTEGVADIAGRNRFPMAECGTRTWERWSKSAIRRPALLKPIVVRGAILWGLRITARLWGLLSAE